MDSFVKNFTGERYLKDREIEDWSHCCTMLLVQCHQGNITFIGKDAFVLTFRRGINPHGYLKINPVKTG
jgi:hypothetical protein